MAVTGFSIIFRAGRTLIHIDLGLNMYDGLTKPRFDE